MCGLFVREGEEANWVLGTGRGRGQLRCGGGGGGDGDGECCTSGVTGFVCWFGLVWFGSGRDRCRCWIWCW